MTYEKYKAWITDKRFDGQFWWLPKERVFVPSSNNKEVYYNFRYRLSYRDSNHHILPILKGQYIGVGSSGLVEIGEFDCHTSLNNLYFTEERYCRCDIEKTELHRIAWKQYENYIMAGRALSKKETFVGHIFSDSPMKTDSGVSYYDYVRID